MVRVGLNLNNINNFDHHIMESLQQHDFHSQGLERLDDQHHNHQYLSDFVEHGHRHFNRMGLEDCGPQLPCPRHCDCPYHCHCPDHRNRSQHSDCHCHFHRNSMW